MQAFNGLCLRPRQFSSFASGSSPLSLRRCRPGPLFARYVHQLRQLPYDIDNGLGDFLSPEGLRVLAVDYQQGILSRLNDLVKGTKMESQSVTDTLLSTAMHKEYALAFNYASQALNNSFFLECLAPPPPSPQTNEDIINHDVNCLDLLPCIRTSFGDLPQLKSTFSAAAMGMINSGWVWLVINQHKDMQIVATFGAGTLLVRSRRHVRTSELPILGEHKDSEYRGNVTSRPMASTEFLSKEAKEVNSPSVASSPASGIGARPLDPLSAKHTRSMSYIPNINSNASLTVTGQSSASNQPESSWTPLLCCSAYEHAWVGTGYGVWGKEEYLRRFWTVVDWKRLGKSFKTAQDSH